VIMKPPIFIRTLSKKERKALEAGLRSSDAFVLRRCQILLASARGERPPRIAENLGCGSQTVRNAIHDFNQRGLDALIAGSSRPRRLHTAFDADGAEALREILHQDPRNFGKEDTFWTLEYAAEVSFEEGLTDRRVSGETIRATLARLGVRWERAKRWIESPDPEYARKKGLATG
jgi:transposase